MTVIVDGKRYSEAEFSTFSQLPNAKAVDARGCTGLTALPDLPNAEYVDVSGCTGLTALPDLPNAKRVYASGCTGLTEIFGYDLPDEATAKKRLGNVAKMALSSPKALEMSSVHDCATTHCIAGWAITLAGEDGRILEDKFGFDIAGTILLGTEASSMFYLSNEEARQRLHAVLAESVE